MQQFQHWKTQIFFQVFVVTIFLIFHNLLDSFEASEFVGQVKRLKNVREWRVPTGDTLNRCFKM